jgi:hypothetical protein
MVTCVFVASVTFFTESLSNNDKGINIQRDSCEGFMKYAAETGSVAMIYLPSFMKFSSAIQTLNEGGVHRHTDSIFI